jgi:hypothetical protein
MDRHRRTVDALGLALVAAALAFGVHGPASSGGLTVAREAAVLQCVLWAVAVVLLVWPGRLAR